MKNWPLLLVNMLYQLLKNLFEWADIRPRKRRAECELNNFEYEEENNYPIPAKRHCCNHTMKNGREVIEVEDDDDFIEILEELNCKKSQKNHRKVPVNISRHSYLQQKNSSSSKNHLSNNSKPFLATKFIKRRSLQNGKSKNLSINESYRLKDKEKYGQLLQDFIPQRLQIFKPKESRNQQPQNIEVIDVENEQSSSKIPDVFSTPKLTTPLSQSRRLSTPGSSRYSTPNTSYWCTPKPWDKSSAPRSKKSIEEIKIDSDDSSAESSINSSIKRKNNILAAPKIILTQPSPRELVVTNTLRDKLSANVLMKKDYVSRINNNYNERTVQRCKEAEELKRVTSLLSKQNRLSREIGLEQQLAQSMKLHEEILVEDDYEEEPSLPELTPEMLDKITRALNPNPPNQVLVESFGLRITRKDIHTLAGLNWLNDEVINFYMNLLIARGGTEKFPPVHAMNTFFYPKLLSGGHASLKRWTRKIDIFAKDIVVVPIHLGVHWCMSIIDFRDKSIRYYDSMGGENKKCLYALKRYIEDESLDKKKVNYDTSDWTLESMKDIPQQMNGSDCGVFSCTFAEFICANRNLTFSQENMPYFRNKMVYEILTVKLL
ncbi:sentrin-specific protease 1-like [Microplitis mediator]|uniref:sentrin-specific protease 1-like n=1 Tax=Microplitis mediator TaxID=375433 RepID=UPI002553DE8F|nr:sentrin-specific protease 1-like [Microplitis mediator]XP_057326521.1 sentrin-specific protease 1-like [Microplitis mediator]